VLPNWAHDDLLEFSLSKPHDESSSQVPKGSGNPNPTVSSFNLPADQIETLTVESPIPTVSLPVPTACLNDSPEPFSEARLISKRVANQEETLSLDNYLSLTNRGPPKSLLKWYGYLSDEYKDKGSSDSSDYDRKGPSKASVPIFEGPSVQRLLDYYRYNDNEEYLSWNYFPSTDKEMTHKNIIDKDIRDEDCIHESNYAMSKAATAAIVSVACQTNDHGFEGIRVPNQKRNTGTKEMDVFLFR
nr:hypothetical protein [Tanacetum cinerariifolium]